jgi:hypothetical protein
MFPRIVVSYNVHTAPRPKDGILHSYSRESPKSYIAYTLSVKSTMDQIEGSRTSETI